MSSVVKVILDAIRSHSDSDDLVIYLQKIPFLQLTLREYDRLLSAFLEECRNSNNYPAADILIDVFSQYNPVQGSLPLFTYLFTNYQYSTPLLTFLAKNNELVTYYEHMINLCDYGDGNDAKIALNRLTNIYTAYDIETFEKIADEAEEKGCDAIVEFCEDMIQGLAPPAPKPTWVRNFLPGEIPYEDELPCPIPPKGFTDASAIPARVDTLMEDLVDYGFNIEDLPEAKDYITRVVSSAHEGERKLFMKENETCDDEACDEKVCGRDDSDKDDTEEQLALHDQVFRTLGPLNARNEDKPENRTEESSSRDDICSKYGGCRMFTCVEYEAYNAEDDVVDPEPDWFTGRCIAPRCTHPKIENRYYAVRKPLTGGGWFGCYCSWACVRRDIKSTIERGMCGPIGAFTARIEGQMDRIGIQDRKIRDYGGEYKSPWQRICKH